MKMDFPVDFELNLIYSYFLVLSRWLMALHVRNIPQWIIILLLYALQINMKHILILFTHMSYDLNYRDVN
jgi:hypothetical protein